MVWSRGVFNGRKNLGEFFRQERERGEERRRLKNEWKCEN